MWCFNKSVRMIFFQIILYSNTENMKDMNCIAVHHIKTNISRNHMKTVIWFDTLRVALIKVQKMIFFQIILYSNTGNLNDMNFIAVDHMKTNISRNPMKTVIWFDTFFVVRFVLDFHNGYTIKQNSSVNFHNIQIFMFKTFMELI